VKFDAKFFHFFASEKFRTSVNGKIK